MKVILGLLMLISVGVLAHQDKVLKISNDGTLIGLPDNYSPSSLDYRKWVLNIVGNQFVFPSCLSEKLNGIGKEQVRISSSWYHIREPRMPNYLYIDIEVKDFGILIALDDAKPFHLKDDSKLTKAEICALIKE